MYEILLFDVDNTLLDFNAGEQTAFAATCRQFNLPYSETLFHRYHTINEAYWQRLEQGTISRDELCVRRFADLADEFHFTYDAAEVDEAYFRQLELQHAWIQHAEEVLQQLGHYQKYLVTNGRIRTQHTRCRDSGLNHYVNGSFISEQLGFSKPDPRFFDTVLEQIGCHDRSTVLILGDSLGSDIQGGINSGIDTCWYHPKPLIEQSDPQPTYIIQDWYELLPLLQTHSS